MSNSRAYTNHPLASNPTRYRFLSSYTNRVLFLSKLKNQFFFYDKLLCSYFCIIFYLLYFVKILSLILIAFTKCNLFFVTSSKHWVGVPRIPFPVPVFLVLYKALCFDRYFFLLKPNYSPPW